MEVSKVSHRQHASEAGTSPSDLSSTEFGPSLLDSGGVIDRKQFVRIIIQALYTLGYRKAAAELESESGVRLQSPEYYSLLVNIITGKWEDCIATIDSIGDLEREARVMASFLVWKEHFLELLGSGDGLLMAKDVLWYRIAPLGMDRRRVHRLARSMISAEGVVPVESKVQRRVGLLLDLVAVLPPWVDVPSGRLEHLVETAVVAQIDSCSYHNSTDEVTLYEDHKCSLEQIPSKCSQVLYDHKNEVWFLQFSNNGRYLASSSSDCTAIIWTVHEDDSLSVKHRLEGHLRPISFVAWSPDDKMLLTCGNGEALRLWHVDTGTCNLRFTDSLNCTISSCAWFPSSEEIVCSSWEPSNRMFTCDLEGNKLNVWEGGRMPKVSDLAVTPDGQLLISICSNREIWIREFTRGKEWVIPEEHSITSLSLSRDGMSLIVNLNSQEIHLWKVDASSQVPDKFKGHKQGKYVIRSCFGGSSCLFIASGSEDSQIYIWRRHCGTPIKVLSGHSKTVNCVAWNPAKPHMLASASDDGTVRIWLANKSTTKIHQ
ncbi:WD repeat-containing protein WDS homolog isoform X1 [Typha latifolia]|uniref:WD repeat-containing protein WDS homolog isoform X1 n=1 Tax=Typha latifolia TaxID=4733 RepID=UPI003C2C3C6C